MQLLMILISSLVINTQDFMCPGASSDHEWSPPESVPKCLLTKIKTVSIRGFKGKLDEMDMAKYLLKNGDILKMMTFHTKDLLRTKEELYKELSMCQWVQRIVKLNFTLTIRMMAFHV